MSIMPNWAECRLWVDGPADRVADFWSNVIKEDDYGIELDYSILVPLNEEGTYDYGMANQKWGTKWTGSDVNVLDEKQVLFNSPWSGPDEYLRTVSEIYPDLLFQLTCVEPGCDFSYKIEFMDGCDSEIEGGDFTVLCEEFGYEICSECGCVCGFSCECEEEDDEEDEVEEVDVIGELKKISMSLSEKTI